MSTLVLVLVDLQKEKLPKSTPWTVCYAILHQLWTFAVYSK